MAMFLTEAHSIASCATREAERCSWRLRKAEKVFKETLEWKDKEIVAARVRSAFGLLMLRRSPCPPASALDAPLLLHMPGTFPTPGASLLLPPEPQQCLQRPQASSRRFFSSPR